MAGKSETKMVVPTEDRKLLDELIALVDDLSDDWRVGWDDLWEFTNTHRNPAKDMRPPV